MKEIISNPDLIAYCGLYCGACPKYLAENCPGCKKNEKATWCGIRTCCMDNNYLSCADCKIISEPMSCKKFNNIFSKVFKLLFGSDRNKCISFIKEKGYKNYADHMTNKKIMTLKK
jgi:hypothetical protein